MLTLIQGWFMNCAMLSRSVGSVFSSRRISCLAGEWGPGEVVEFPQCQPHPPAVPHLPPSLHVLPKS